MKQSMYNVAVPFIFAFVVFAGAMLFFVNAPNAENVQYEGTAEIFKESSQAPEGEADVALPSDEGQAFALKKE